MPGKLGFDRARETVSDKASVAMRARGRGYPALWVLALPYFFSYWIGLSSGLSSFLQGPRFTQEPPSQVVFLNTSGTMIPCAAEGKPTPGITWVKSDGSPVTDVPGLRHLRTDGSLVFPPFAASNYRQDVHSTVYRCLATNNFGTVGSRDLHVRGVVHQDYQAHVYDEYVIRGNTAVLRCRVPSYVMEYHVVTSWTRDDGMVFSNTKHIGSKYFLTRDGELLIRNADSSDSFRRYQCHVRNQLTGETKFSVTTGQLIVTDPTNSMAPKITLRRSSVLAVVGETAELVCAGQGYPPPSYHWMRSKNGHMMTIHIHQRLQRYEGTLLINNANLDDAGKYFCTVNNSVDTQQVETELSMRGNLSVHLSPPAVSAELNQPVSFNCSVVGYPILSVIWLKNQVPLSANNRVRFVGHHQLQLNAIQRDDQGMYQCLARSDGQSAQATAQLALSEDAPVLKQAFSRLIVKTGDRISLCCVAAGNPLPRVTWTLDGRPIPENHRVQYGDFVSSLGEVVSFVNVSSATSEDGGVYTCTAENEAGSSKHWDRVDIYGPPFIRPMGNVTVVAGNDLIYHCPVGGYPMPNVTWSRDGRLLPFNDRQSSFPNGTVVILNITREADQGTYVCQAQKDSTKIHKEVKLIVLKQPVINPFAFPTNLVSGMRVIITCSVLTGDPPIAIRWLKDGQLLRPQSLDFEETPLGDLGSSLVFSNIGRKNNGNYTCVAENAAGASKYSANMVVNVAPIWRLEPRDVSAVLGNTVVLDCQADGHPPPITRWKRAPELTGARNFQAVTSNFHIQALENGSLIIKNVEKGDEGFYLCEAVNGIGVGLSSSIKLSVHVSAHFKNNFNFVRIKKGDKLKLSCEAFGDGPVQLKWRKEKMEIDPAIHPRYIFTDKLLESGIESTMTVNSGDRRESSLFTCLASNAYGSDEKRIQVVVEEPPDAPFEVQVISAESRTAIITWSVPYTGNSPISSYHLYWKKDKEQWPTSSLKFEIPGSENKVTLRDLSPMTDYTVKVIAQNAIGTSEASSPISFSTDTEVPEEPPHSVEAIPVSSHSIRVTWKPPTVQGSHGQILGYYVGYKVQGSSDPFVYKTLDVTGHFNNECLLNNLRRFTKYNVILQAFNKKGAGPPSKEVSARTLENDPPTAPELRLASTTATSVLLTWHKSDEEDNELVKGFTVFYKHEDSEWEQVNISGEVTTYSFQSLNCGTHYQFNMVAYNDVGKSELSETISVTTQGAAPVAPSKHTLLVANSTSASLILGAWEDGGCPVSNFAVQLKPRGLHQWTMVSNNISPTQEKYVLTGLSSASWYHLLMSAHNPAGTTEAEFVFATLTSSGGTVSPAVYKTEESSTFYRSLPAVVSLVCAGLVLIIIVLVVFVVCLRKSRTAEDATSTQETDRRNADSKADNISMTSVGKKMFEGQRGDGLYYPSPYVTARVSMYSAESGSSSEQNSSLHRNTDQRNQHIYDVPFPPKQQYTYQCRNSSGLREYQPLHSVSPHHEKTYASVTSKLVDENYSDFKPCLSREWTKYNKLANHRMKEDRPRETYHSGYRDELSSYESNPEDFETFFTSCNTGDSNEMSEAECDRDYRSELKQASKNMSGLPFYMVRPAGTKEYDVYLN